MNKQLTKLLFIALCIPIIITQGCSKKDDETSKPQTEMSTLTAAEKVEIAELKVLLFELTAFPVEKITYNEEDQSFYYMNVKQITKENLHLVKAAR